VQLDVGGDVSVGGFATPTLGDIDEDGLDDLLVGDWGGYVNHFRNVGDGTFTDMGQLVNETPPTTIGSIVGMYCHPFVIDWDLDNDLDLFCGTVLGQIHYLANNGDDTFTSQGRLKDGVLDLRPGPKSSPLFIDWNGDGDKDLIAGNFNGDIKYYENQGGSGIDFTYIGFLEWFDGMSAQPISGMGNNIVPSMVDWDGDSKMDLITSNGTPSDGGIDHWKGAIADLFDPPVERLNYIKEINARAVDWNGDGSYDFMTGELGGYVRYYRNDGLDSFNMILMQNGTEDLFVPSWSSPFPIDFDGDSVLDLMIGDANGDVWFFRGTTPGSNVMNFVSILTGSGAPQAIRVGPPGIGHSRPSAVDWDNDKRVDLVVGETNGWVWLFTNDGDQTFSSMGKAHNETGANLRGNGYSAPSVGDWNGDLLLDLIVGDSMGYVHLWQRRNAGGDMFNFTDVGRLQTDAGDLKVTAYAVPYVDDWNADGDLDILVGDESGRVLYYENDGDGTLSYMGNLSNSLGGDLKISSRAAPVGKGFYVSTRAYKGGIGIYSVDSSPDIRFNIMIKGGDGNRTAGQGEMGGTGIYLLRSDATIVDNKNISGGTGGLGIATPAGDVIGGQGGHGIFLDDSSGWIERNLIFGGLGGEAEVAVSPAVSMGGAGGSGVFSSNYTTTYIYDNIITGGEGNTGVDQAGSGGAGIWVQNNSQPYIEDCVVSGIQGVYVDNSTPFVVNSTITATLRSFNVTNQGHAIALNTTFDRTKTYYGDDASVLEAQWFLNIKVVDRSGFAVPDATVTVERDGFSFQGHLPFMFGPLTTGLNPAPAVMDWDEDGLQDLIVGESDGDVVFLKNLGNGQFQTPITLLRGVDIGMTLTRPFAYDLDFDLVPDIVLGDSQGRVFWYKKNGPNLEYYDTFKIVNESGAVIGDLNVSSNAAPSIGRWSPDGFWDLVVGDGSGFVNIFAREPGSFVNFKFAGYAEMTDGTPVKVLRDAVPFVVDWNQDGHRDLVLSSSGQVLLYLSCENGTLLWGGPFMANNSGLQPIQLMGLFSAATVLDFNGDGDLDLVVGARNTSLINTGNIEYFESNKNGDSRTFTVDALGERNWVIATEFIESDKNGNHLGDDPGDKDFYTPHMVKAKKNIEIGCAVPQPAVTQSRNVYVQMCKDVTLPVVVDTYPKSGQVGVKLFEKIKIWFSKPMNPNITTGKITITSNPALAYTTTWFDNNTLVELDPLPNMTFDTHYLVRIRGSAIDVAGKMLDGNRNGVEDYDRDADDYTFSFHTEFIDPQFPPTAVLEHWPWPNKSAFVAPVVLQFDGRNSTDDRGVEYWLIEGYTGTSTFLNESDDIQNATTPPIWFNITGVFCVNLTVWDAVSLANTTTQCLNITGQDITNPTANAGPDQTIAPSQMITFDGSGSSDNITPTAMLNYTWRFNNGTTDITLWGMQASYSGFDALGFFPVTLNVSDEAGNNDTDTMGVNVVLDPPPDANAGPSQDVCSGTLVTLDASGTQDNSPLSNLFFNWTFDDGVSPVFLQGMIVAHPFIVVGEFEIILEVTDESGGMDIATTWVNVTDCIPPYVTESGPRGPDKPLDSVVWAEFSKEMRTPDLYFSFSLVDTSSGASITGIQNYTVATSNFTFTPDEPLSNFTTYEACFNADIAVDIEGFFLDGDHNNQSEGSPTDDFCWQFQTVMVPTIDATTPLTNEQDVSVKTDIKISFNEPMDTSSVQLAFSLTDGTTTWDSTSFSVSWTGGSRGFTFAGFPFEFLKSYTVTVEGSTARSLNDVYLDGDLDGTPEGSPTDDYSWSFTTEISPTVMGIPTGSNVPLNADIVLSFNKVMDWTSVHDAVTIIENVTAVPIDSFGRWTPSDISRTFTIEPFALIHGTKYSITLSGDLLSGAMDLNGNSLDGNKNGVLEGTLIDDYSWEFTTTSLDFDPPHVISTFPTNGLSNVPVNTVITIEFDELMNQTSFPTGTAVKIDSFTFTLDSFAGFEWFDANMTLALYPIGGLSYDTNYTIILSGSFFNGVVDLAGNPLDGNGNGFAEGTSIDDHRFWFKTPDPVPPSVVNTTPAAGETNVTLGTSITATFDDDMDESTLQPENFTVRDQFGNAVDGQLYYDPGMKTLTFDPDQNLKPTRTYTVNISSVKDDDGNIIVDGYYVWSFTTQIDAQPPTVVILSPLDQDEVKKGDELTIIGTATDNSEIETLQIRIAGGSWIDIVDYNSTDGSWSYIWNTKDSSLGTVTIEVQAYDSSFLRGSDQVSILITEVEDDIVGVVLLGLAIIIAVVSTLVFLLMWRRRREAGEEEVEPEEDLEDEDAGEEEALEREEDEAEALQEEVIEDEEMDEEEVLDVEEDEETKEEEELAEERPVGKIKKPVRRIKK
jgi:hypothetical protein